MIVLIPDVHIKHNNLNLELSGDIKELLAITQCLYYFYGKFLRILPCRCVSVFWFAINKRFWILRLNMFKMWVWPWTWYLMEIICSPCWNFWSAGKPKKQKCEIVRAARRAYLAKQSNFLIISIIVNLNSVKLVCFVLLTQSILLQYFSSSFLWTLWQVSVDD